MKKALLAFVFGIGFMFSLASAQDMPATVVDVATSNEDFSVLVEAVVAADLAETLSGEGPFTVFAPTNDAFVAALEALGLSKEELLASPDLAGILTYHVVAGKLMATDVLAAVEAGGGTAEVETVNGAPITVTVVDGMVMLNGTATVTATDIEAGNGVVHVIDAVILPPSE
ncbi:MAG: fasciclin domain-containing protein [Trueperaceae bacterium]|nr:fasciclin domain-containing protein [Trueperaceae bacterium]